MTTAALVKQYVDSLEATVLQRSVRESTTMFTGIIGLLTTLAVVLYSDLAESQCTTRYCEDHDEANLLAVVEQLQQQFSTLNLKHERLQQQFSTLNLKHERLQQEVSTTEERNQEVVGQLQRTVTELKEELANLTKRKHSSTFNVFDILSHY